MAFSAYGNNLGYSRTGAGSLMNATQYVKEVLNLAQPNLVFPQFAYLDIVPEKKAGDTVVVTIDGDMSTGGALLADGTPIPLGSFTSSQISIAINEYGKQLTWSGAWDEIFSWSNNARRFRTALANNYMREVNDIFKATVFSTSGIATFYSDTAVAGGSLWIGTQAGAPRGLAPLGTYLLNKIWDDFRKNNVPPFMANGLEFYVCVANPVTLRGLKASQALQNFNLYAADRGQNNPLFTNQVGFANGFLFLESSTMNTGSGMNGGTCYAFGRDAYAFAVSVPIGIRYQRNIVNDYDRMHGVAWYGIFGAGMVFGDGVNGAPARIVRIYTNDNY